MHQPLITIITVTYQAEALIETTIRSVTDQTYSAIEHILIDGGSTDATVSKAEACMRPQRIVVSEPDNGLYDAMNKGLEFANGEFVLFLNAGDVLHTNDTLEQMISLGGNWDCIYGETQIIDENEKALGLRRLQPPRNLSWKSFDMGMCVSHQSVLMRRRIAVPFDLQYAISADIDWCIRSLKRARKTVYCPFVVSDFRIGGVSTSRRKQGLSERWQIMLQHYGWFRTVWSHIKITFRYVWQRLTRRSMD
jgi:glycosyltransferase involved in cell wall biosynthesis